MQDLAARAFGAVLWALLLMGSCYVDTNVRESGHLLSRNITYVPSLFLFTPIMVLLLQQHRQIAFLHAALQLLPELFLFTLLLLAFSPWLRRRYSAQSCADLWALPGVLVNVFLYTWFVGFDPWLSIRLPRFALWTLLGLWAACFCGILIWKTGSHLRFRRTVLRDAMPVSPTEQELFQQVWAKLIPNKRLAVYGKRLKLVHSPALSSPLTIGLFSKTMVLALPTREYSREELELIFRHESVHLMRQDNIFKFSTVVLCAAGWFIPSLWAVMRRASEDLELCCDEIVTAGMKKAERREYATLLLSSAGTERGFTTCLSASAKSLRYRLRRIMRRRKSKEAIWLIGLLTALYIFFFGVIGLELDVGTVQSELLGGEAGDWRIVRLDPAGYLEPFGDPELIKAAEESLLELRLARPLWVEWEKNESAYHRCEVIATLWNNGGSTATLCVSEDSVYLLREDSQRTPVYRILGDFDPEELLQSLRAEAN